MSAPSKPRHRKRYSIIISTGAKDLQANHLALYTPDLKDVISEVQKGLELNFSTVECGVLDKCPDLSEWGNLSTKGICGSTRIADVGGLPYLYCKKYQKKTKYQLPDIVKACGLKKTAALVFGSAHASQSIIGKTGELCVNSKVPGSRHTRYIKIDKLENKENKENNENDEKNENNSQVIPIYGPMVNFYPSEEIGCKATMFICDGNNNESVLYIKVKGRKGKLNIIETIRQSLKRIKGVDKSAQIGVGGVIKVLKGKVNTHISPDFVQVDYNNKEAIEKTYKYYEFGPNLMMFTTFLTDDPSENGKLHLTLQSTNCYSLNPHCNEGGVFVESATDDIIEYEGYFNFAKYIYRVEDAYYNISIEQ